MRNLKSLAMAAAVLSILTSTAAMRALGRTFDLPAGSLLSLDRGLTHDVEALEDSALLLTVAWRGRDGS